MQEGVREAVVRSGARLRGATRATLLTLLCSGAFAPVVAAAVGAGAVVTAGVGVLGGLGGGALSNLIGEVIDRLRRPRGQSPATVAQVEQELASRIDELLAAGGAEAEALRREIAAVLREVGAAQEAVRAAVAAGDEQLQNEVMGALGDLASEFAEFGFMLAEVRQAAVQLQHEFYRQDAERRFDRDRNRQQAVQLRLIRDKLVDIERAVQAGAGTEPGGPVSWTATRWLDQPPFRGLWPFHIEHEEVFFGRDRLTAELTGRVEQRLAAVAMTIVTGASGAGKSSLLRAGLLPAIARGQLAVPGAADWPRVVLTPGASPLVELAAQLALAANVDAATVRRTLAERPQDAHLLARQAVLAAASSLPPGARDALSEHGRLLLVVDQLEELFTLTDAEVDRRAFIAALLSIAGASAAIDQPEAQWTPDGPGSPSGAVIVGLRGDFVDRCAAYPQLVPVLQDGTFVVGAMTEAELRQVITGPAAVAGVDLEPGLADDILAELRTTASAGAVGVGALPLLSQAMLLTWQHREGNRLTRRSYAAIGGLTRSVETSAEEVYLALSPREQTAARNLFRRMTIITRDGQLARRQVPNAEFGSGAAGLGDGSVVDSVLDAFTAKRLIVRGSGTVEIAHDAVLHAWPRLRAWTNDDSAARATLTRLLDDAATWRAHHRDPSFLYRGTRLSAVDQVRKAWDAAPERYPALDDTVQEFLRQSHRRASRSARIRRMVAAGLAVLVAIAAAAAGVAASARRIADERRDEAISRRLAAESERVRHLDGGLAQLLAAAAWEIGGTPEARVAMMRVMDSPARGLLSRHGDRVSALAFSPDGAVLASGSWDKTVLLWDMRTRTPSAPLTHPTIVSAVAFSHDGDMLAVAGRGEITLWDVATGTARGTLSGHPGMVNGLAFSPDGETLVSGGDDGTVRLWDVAAGEQRKLLSGHTDRVTAVAFSPDGTTVATGSSDETVRLWDAGTGGERKKVPVKTSVRSIAYSPDGSAMTIAGFGGVWRWDATRSVLTELPAGSADAVTYSPDGAVVVAASRGIKAWDAATGAVIATLAQEDFTPYAVAFSPDGTVFASGGDEGIRLWAAAAAAADHTILTGHEYGVNQVQFSADGTMLASASVDGVRLWSAAGTQAAAFEPGAGNAFGVSAVALSPDASTVATGSGGGTDVLLRDRATGRTVGTLEGHKAPVAALAFSPDGTLLASAAAHDSFDSVHEDDARILLWDIATGQLIKTLTGHAGWGVLGLEFSPDGTLLASASAADHTVRLWDVATGEERMSLPGAMGSLRDLAFSADGTMVAAPGGVSGAVMLWNVSTGEPVATLTETRMIPTAVAFGPDGATVAVGTTDDVRLWDLDTGEPTAVLRGDTDRVESVTFSPDGMTLAMGVDDGTVRLWDVGFLADPHAAVCSGAGRTLTPQEWQRYVPELSHRSVCQQDSP